MNSSKKTTAKRNGHRKEFNGLHIHPLAAGVRWALASAALASMGTGAAELPVPKSTFATLGRADHLINGNTLTVKQHTDRAILNWQKFNVGKDAAVRFDQPSAASIALNRIAQSDPSQILGSVSANGQIYLINQNGFVFGKDARVNANTLVTSTLDISDDTFSRGITKVVDQDGRAALTGSGEVYLRDASGQYILDDKGQRQKIKIQVQQGATLKADKNGRIILAAPSIENRGEISAPDGQILMVAASDKVYLQEAGSDSKLRGLVVEVGTGGDVSNFGKVVAERGNATLMGFAVNQNGRVSASTAVQVNGSVRLLAREGAATRREGDRWLLEPKKTTRANDLDDGLGRQAKVSLGAGSVTEAVPDAADHGTAVDSQTQDPSRIEVMGQSVQLREGASLRAPSGEVSITATEAPDQPGLPSASNGSRIFLEKGASIDVGGLKNVSLPMERNVADVELRSNELRDSPLQKKGILYAKTVKVDLRKGTPIADISGARERVARTVEERSTRGGRLEMLSEGDAVLSQGSVVDFSGGSLAYQDGYIHTTQLLSQGKMIDIGDADPNRLYDGILGDVTKAFPRWNIVRRWRLAGLTNMGRFEKGYVEGKDAGVFDVRANSLLLDGDLRGQSVNGLHQREPAQRAQGGDLRIDLARTPTSTQGVVFQAPTSAIPVSADGAFPTDPANAGAPAPLVISGSRLHDAGVMKASIKTGGRVEIRSGTRVAVEDGGALSLTGGEVRVDGGIEAHNGEVSLSTQLTSATRGKLSGEIRLAAGSVIDASGRWLNDRPGGRIDTDLAPIWTAGGHVTVRAQGDVAFDAGSRIDVSGGARRGDDGSIVAGDAGAISLEAADVAGSNLSVSGELFGYAVSGAQTGSLSLTGNEIRIGEGIVPEGDGPLRPLVLAPDFFRRGGFSRYRLESNKHGVSVEPGTALDLAVQSRILDETVAVDRVSGSNLADFSQIVQLPEPLRPAAELDLVLAQRAGQGRAGAAVSVGTGALVRTGAGGRVGLRSDSSIFMNGSIEAPAGDVSLTITPPVGTDPAFLDDQGIWIGAGAHIAARGVANTVVDAKGLLTGEILDGGDVVLHANRGFVVAETGSSIDVSGASGLLDAPGTDASGRFGYRRQQVGSSGGRIEIGAAEGVQMAGSLSGRAGAGGHAGGGELVFEINPLTRAEPDDISAGQKPFPTVPSVVEVSAAPNIDAGSGQPHPIPAGQHGKALFKSGWIEEGGFAAAKLKSPDRIEFTGDIQLRAERSVELDAPQIRQLPSVSGDAGKIDIAAAHVVIGSSQVREVSAAPLAGTAAFNVEAGLIDLQGAAHLEGFASTNLVSSGDVRLLGIRSSSQQRDFKGELVTAGDVGIQADQVYPTTLSDYRLSVVRKGGTLEIRPGDGGAKPVLSAGGKLSLEADNIVQNGTLRSPLGELDLRAADSLTLGSGSVTSNAAAARMTPFGRTQGGLDWIYPLGTQNLVFSAPPEKNLSLEAAKVDIASGATVDTSGGGDLFAFEFVPGPGGSVDILDPGDPKYVDGSFAYQQKFAVLPGLKDGFAPVDPLETPASGLKVGDSVHLSGGGGLAAGTYALLPAHYALLPGAFLVTPETGGRVAVPGMSELRSDGATVVPGYRTVAGTGIRDFLWSGFAVESAASINQRAEYTRSHANAFFEGKAQEREVAPPMLPRDAGTLRFAADASLNLNGNILATPADQGRGGRLDIAANRIAIVSRADSAVDGSVSLVAEDLNKLDVSSVLIGGVRTREGDATQLDTRASEVAVGPGVQLQGKELLLSARDRISVAEGARLQTAGSAPATTRESIGMAGDGALVRLSSGKQADLTRTEITGSRGSIDVKPGASLAANGSMLLDATLDSSLQGRIEMNGGSLALGASHIGIGTPSAATGGLALSADTLAGLKVDELILDSRSDLTLFGNVTMDLGRLEVKAAGLIGQAGAGQTAVITADSIRLHNPDGAASSSVGSGSGTLALRARQIELGDGDFSLRGFSSAAIEAKESVLADGRGSLSAASDLSIAAAVITGSRGADTTIDAGGHAVDIRPAGGTVADGTALGARLTVNADRIDHAGRIRMPAGAVSLTAATGDLNIRSGAEIDVSGRTLSFGDQSLVAPGGRISLSAARGSVDLASGALLDVHGDSAGTLAVSAGGEFRWNGRVDAAGVARKGSLELDVGQVGTGGDLSDWASRLTSAGFGDAVSIRAREGDLSLPQGVALTAHQLELTADRGSIRLAGSMTATGGKGLVSLRSGDALRLESGATLTATDAGSSGRIVLDAADGDRDGVSALDVQPGANIALQGGVLDVRVARSGTDVALSGDLRGAVTGESAVHVEAVRSYQKDGEITAADIQAWKADTDAYMAHADVVEARLGLPGALRPGLEIVAAGDLRLSEGAWDLLDWRYGGRTGVLSLSAGGNLAFEQDLSDGFKAYEARAIDLSGLMGAGQFMAVKDLLQTGPSWSFNLSAGQDVTLGRNVSVRTGTGDIRVEAGRDFKLADDTASLYTAGRAEAAQRYGSFKDGYVAFEFYGEYPVQGGDVSIAAGRDVVGARTGQFFDGWLVRAGTWTRNGTHAGETPTAWGVALGQADRNGDGLPLAASVFRQNIGALGGGDVNVRAGRDVVDLSAVIPTTGKQVGEASNPASPSNLDFNSNQVQVAGGGDLTVDAGRDVRGGVFYAAAGDGLVRAGGAVGASSVGTLGPVVGLGDARFRLEARQDVLLGAALNPTVVYGNDSRSLFFTYGDASELQISSLAGDARIQNDVSGIIDAANALRGSAGQLRFPGTTFDALSVYPASLNVAALQGDISLERSLIMYPAAKGQLSLLAGQNITTGDTGVNVNITQSDADPGLLPSTAFPVRNWEDATQRLQPFGAANLIHAQTPVHRGDSVPVRIQAQEGSLAPKDPLLFVLPKFAQVRAGKDMQDVSFNIQHADDSISQIAAGRDIRFTSPRNTQGNLVNLTREIAVAGPGELQVFSGRTVDLGASEGIYTLGNSFNSALAEKGADISIFSGQPKPPAFDAFSAHYLEETGGYREALAAYMHARTGDESLNADQTLAAFKALPEEQRRAFLLDVFFGELRASASAAAKEGAAGYQRGYDAIARLFPDGQTYAGDLKLFFSKVHTIDGGNINLLVPGGLINAGLAVAFSGQKAASDLGIVAQREGQVNAYLKNDFQVNQSRVFAMDGGDITIWSAAGDIDAGRGAKAAIAAPPPIVTFDSQGNLKVDFPPVVSGSGIRTASSSDGVVPGDVFLAAPKGVVNAGEAGIGGNNVTIAATAVIGASNINVSGVSSGVPTAAVAAPVTPMGAANAAASAAQAAQQNADAAEKKDAGQSMAKSAQLTPLNVEVVGFGDCTMSDIREGKAGCG